MIGHEHRHVVVRKAFLNQRVYGALSLRHAQKIAKTAVFLSFMSDSFVY